MILKRKKEPADRSGTVAGQLARGALSVVLAVSLCPTAAFADSDGLAAANAPLTSADSNTVSDVVLQGGAAPLDAQEGIALEDADVTLSFESVAYTAKAQKPTVTVSKNGSTLTSGTDFTVKYANNKEAGQATVTVAGTGSYTGTVTKNFTITACNLSDCTVTLTNTEEEYTGFPCKPSVAIKTTVNGTVATSNYTVTCKNIDVGEATATITPVEGKSLVGDPITKTFQIVPISITETTIEKLITGTNSQGNTTFRTVASSPVVGESTYTGEVQNPELPQLILFVNASGGQTRYNLNAADYTNAGWSNNTNVGEATITLTGKGNFKDSLNLKWTINAKSLADKDVTVSGLVDQTWTGSAVTPPEPVVKVGERTLVKGTDYEVFYPEDLTNAGAKQVTITGKGNYAGSPEGTSFRIGKSLANAEVTVADADKQVYTGSPLTPAVTVKLADDTLTADQDYTVQYSDNTNAGTATVTITGAEDYAGTVTKTFEIAKAEVAAPSAVSGLTYNGKEQTGVVVADGAGYTATGTTGTNAGPYTATLTADSNHVFADGKTKAEVAWSIARAQVAKPTAKTDLKYTGKAQTGVTFAKNAGYTVSGTTSATNVGGYSATAELDSNHAWAGGSTADVTVKWSIAKAASSVSLAAQSKTYTGKALAYSGKVTKSGSTGAVTYKYYSNAACTKAATPKAAGTYYVKATVAENANYAAATSAAVKFTIAKAANPLAVKAASKTLKAKAVKKKAQSFKPSIVKVKGQGALSYAKYKVNKKAKNFTVNKKTGKITVKKGTPKGTYTVKVKVTAAGNANYKASAAKVAKVKVKVK